MKKIGIFSIKEQFSADLFKSLKNIKRDDIFVENPVAGETKVSEKSPYRVIVDRISPHVSYFKAHFKNASLMGACVINNPVGDLALDRFYNYSQAKKLGLVIPRTVALPTREYHPSCSARDLTNLKYPLDWEEIADFIGFPAILKPYQGHGYRDVYNVNSIQELIECYNGTGQQIMLMQEFIESDYYVRIFAVGKKHTYLIIEDPYKNEYSTDRKLIGKIKLEPIMEGVLNICRRMDIDFCSAEFSVKDHVPYAINFLTTNPDCRPENMTDDCYRWILEKLTDTIIEAVDEDRLNSSKPDLQPAG